MNYLMICILLFISTLAFSVDNNENDIGKIYNEFKNANATKNYDKLNKYIYTKDGDSVPTGIPSYMSMIFVESKFDSIKINKEKALAKIDNCKDLFSSTIGCCFVLFINDRGSWKIKDFEIVEPGKRSNKMDNEIK